jgi:hypothetical protein
MNIQRGWSIEYGNLKCSIMIEEVDLLCMLAERGAEDPAKVRAGMLTRDAYLAMDAECQAFLHDTLRKKEPEDSQARRDLAAKVKEYRAERNRLLDSYVRPAPAAEAEGEPAE